MHEIEVATVFYAAPEWVLRHLTDLVPADVRYAACFKASHSAAQKSQPGMNTEFFGLFKEHLHTDTHSEQRRARSHTLAPQPIEASGPESPHASGERADARQHQPLGVAQVALTIAHKGNATGGAESLLDRAQTAAG